MDDSSDKKARSVYEIFVWFLMVDWDIEEMESDSLLLEFFDFLENRLDWKFPELDFKETIKKIFDDPLNFSKNATFLKTCTTPEERMGIVTAISQIMLTDGDFGDNEYNLYMKLLNFWEITPEDLKKQEI